MKQGKIYLYDQYVGLLTEDETGFTFAYDADYLASSQAEAVSLTLPLSNEPYHDTVLFPFFDGLIPEGWLLNIAESSWKINQRDRMSLLLACCKDCIGAVSVIPVDAPWPWAEPASTSLISVPIRLISRNNPTG